MKRATIKDIADSLNLSVSTVSRALADGANIRRETKDKVFAAAREMGYRRNINAATLRTGRSNTIAVLVNQMVSPFASGVLRGIHERMHKEDVIVRVYDSDNNPERERQNVRMVEQSLVDGVIVAHCHHRENIAEYRRLQEKGIPMVFYTSRLEGIDTPSVGLNSYDKAFYLLDHMICSGRKRIVNIMGPCISDDMKNIEKAYRDSMRKFGLPVLPEYVRRTGLTMADGLKIGRELLDEGLEFDGVFTVSELVGIGVMHSLQERGIRIPEDVSVAAFLGSELSKMVYPQLTSVEPHHEDMGYKAADILLKKIRNQKVENERVIVDAKIRLRGSSHAAALANA